MPTAPQPAASHRPSNNRPRRTILIGTADACGQLAGALATLPGWGSVAGAVTLDGSRPTRTGLSLLDSVHTVGLICRQHGIARAIVTLPAERKVESAMSRAGADAGTDRSVAAVFGAG